MFDNPFEEFTPTFEDCLIETGAIVDESQSLNDDDLIDFLVQKSYSTEIGDNVDIIIGKYFKYGRLTEEDRTELRGCYVLLISQLTIGDDGEIYVLGLG
jgi:hypothetical protein